MSKWLNTYLCSTMKSLNICVDSITFATDISSIEFHDWPTQEENRGALLTYEMVSSGFIYHMSCYITTKWYKTYAAFNHLYHCILVMSCCIIIDSSPFISAWPDCEAVLYHHWFQSLCYSLTRFCVSQCLKGRGLPDLKNDSKCNCSGCKICSIF